MTQQSTHIDDLIVRFFTEDLTADEQSELSRWKAASPDNRAYFARLEDIWLSVSVAEGNRKYHKDEAYAGFLKRKTAAETRRPISGRGRWSRLKYAAAGLLAVGLFSYLSYNSGKQGVMSEFADITVEARSEEHTSELQSRQYLVCRLLLEKKKNIYIFLPRPLTS